MLWWKKFFKTEPGNIKEPEKDREKIIWHIWRSWRAENWESTPQRSQLLPSLKPTAKLYPPKNWWQRETVAFPCWVTVRPSWVPFPRRVFFPTAKKKTDPQDTAQRQEMVLVSCPGGTVWCGMAEGTSIHHSTGGNMEHGYKGETWTAHWNLTNKYPKWSHMLKPKVHFFLEKLSCLVSIFGNFLGVLLVLWNSGKGLDPNHGYIPLSAQRENKNFASQTSWLGPYWFGDFLTPSDVSPTKCPVILFWFDWNTRYTSRGPCEAFYFTRMYKTFPHFVAWPKQIQMLDWVNLGSPASCIFFTSCFYFLQTDWH